MIRVCILILIYIVFQSTAYSCENDGVPGLGHVEEFLENYEIVQSDRFFPEIERGDRRISHRAVLHSSCMSGPRPGQARRTINMALNLALSRAMKCYEKFRFRELPSLINRLRQLRITCEVTRTENAPPTGIMGHAKPLQRSGLRLRHSTERGEYRFDLNPNVINQQSFITQNYARIAETIFHEALHLTPCNNRHDHNEIERLHPNNCSDPSRYTDRVVFISSLCMPSDAMTQEDFCEANCFKALTETTPEHQSLLENRFSRRWARFYVGRPYQDNEAQRICSSVSDFRQRVMNSIDMLSDGTTARVSRLFPMLSRDFPAQEESFFRRGLGEMISLMGQIKTNSSLGFLESEGNPPEELDGFVFRSSARTLIRQSREKIRALQSRLQQICSSPSRSFCTGPTGLALRSQLELLRVKVDSIPADVIDWLDNPSVERLSGYY